MIDKPHELLPRRVTLPAVGWRRLGAWFDVTPCVVSTHRSKSCILPVVRYELSTSWVLVRDNFYNIMVSVSCQQPITWLPSGISADKPIRAVYCEGFPADLVFPSWAKSPHMFTIELDTVGQLLDVMTMAKRAAVVL